MNEQGEWPRQPCYGWEIILGRWDSGLVHIAYNIRYHIQSVRTLTIQNLDHPKNLYHPRPKYQCGDRLKSPYSTPNRIISRWCTSCSIIVTGRVKTLTVYDVLTASDRIRIGDIGCYRRCIGHRDGYRRCERCSNLV